MKFCLCCEASSIDLLGSEIITVNPPNLSLFYHILDRNAFFAEREFLETRPRFKQIIPYCVLKWADEILVYQRRSKHSENRLSDKWSIGIGGHVEPKDCLEEHSKLLVTDILGQAIKREVLEETGIYVKDGSKILSLFLNLQNSNLVQQVHFGAVYIISFHTHVRPKIVAQDNELKQFAWERLDTFNYDRNFEEWSLAVLENAKFLNS